MEELRGEGSLRKGVVVSPFLSHRNPYSSISNEEARAHVSST